MHIAVVYFGLARRTSATLGSILRHVFAANAAPGVRFTALASLNLVTMLNNPRSHEVGIPVDPADGLLLDADCYLLHRQDDAAIAEPLAAVQGQKDVFGDGWASIRNMLHQLRSLERAWPLVEALRPAPDHVLFLRPDLDYLDPFPLADIAAAFDGEGCIALPSWASHGGFSDRFAFADLVAARHYALRIDRVAAYCRDYPLAPESFLAHTLASAGCRAMDLPVTARRIRAYGGAKGEVFVRNQPLGPAPRPLRVAGATAVVEQPVEPAAAAPRPPPAARPLLRRPLRFKSAIRPAVVEVNGFTRVRALGGHHYLDMLRFLHAEHEVARYLEIGTQKGRSLSCARSDAAAIAVDPVFWLDRQTWSRPGLHFFEMTSDAFFAAHDPSVILEGPIDLTFVDGVPLSDQVLRDFANAERHAARDGLIVLHNTMPMNFEMATRDWRPEARRDRDLARAWTGDAWRVLPLLRRERPDLRIQVLDCPLTGLVLVGNLDPSSTVLGDRMDALVAELVGIEPTEAEFWSFVQATEMLESRSLLPATWREVVSAAVG